jgi:hypothetical protein
MEWISTLACLICGSRKVQVCHTGPHGLSTKAHDIWTVPLCQPHHLGALGLDVLGPGQFESVYHVDMKKEVLNLIARYIHEKLETGGIIRF